MLLSSDGVLQKNLECDVDFVVVPPNVWTFLVRCYGGGPEILQTLVAKKINDKDQITVELYPITVNVIINFNGGDMHGEWEFSESATVQSLIDFCAKKSVLLGNNEFKLYRFFQGEKKEEYEDHSATLQEVG